MSRIKIIISIVLFALLAVVIFFFFGNKDSSSGIKISYPFNSALFPPEFPAPTFAWQSENHDSGSWEITLTTNNNSLINFTTRQNRWTPEKSEWESIKDQSDFKKIYFKVRKTGDKKQSDQISFSISRDSVGAPVLYRQMPIPFAIAEKQLDSMNYMLIDFGSYNPPHVAMRGFPVCGNCHSFSADGNTIGLDLDAGRRDKGGYFISEFNDTLIFDQENYMSWSKIEKRSTFGLFSKISPDGRYIVTTVRDRVVSISPPMNTAENFAYSLIFLPVNGILAVYDRKTKVLKQLPGANLDEYVQSNAFWTPDGKNIVFCRAKALPRDSNIYKLIVEDSKLLDQFEKRELPFKYDLCLVPFNNGEGGEAELVKGASDNGKSNFFPTVSPDGKWLVYCQAENYMHLMPDSRLYIIPVKGGKSRMLKCNMYSLNSWHAWSPNSKWIVFASKGLSVFTDLFLTHIDDHGNASLPVLVDKAREYQRVNNYPEFVNRKPDDRFVMEYEYVELAHIKFALRDGKNDEARDLFDHLIDQNPFFFSEDYAALSGYLFRMGLTEESRKYAELAKNSLNSFVPEHQ
jgi:tetratricopeptide (TPR) repeat protein